MSAGRAVNATARRRAADEPRALRALPPSDARAPRTLASDLARARAFFDSDALAWRAARVLLIYAPAVAAVLLVTVTVSAWLGGPR